MRFLEGNKCRFWMDFRLWEGVPSDRDFRVVGEGPHEGWVTLVAPGYGLPADYGNGSIYIRRAGMKITGKP